jgi:tRNA (Thr-GGU) A37 N-methylase
MAAWPRSSRCRLSASSAAGYTDTESTPIQARLNAGNAATIEIGEQYADGLDGLAGFDFAWVLTWLHQPRGDGGPPRLRHVPFLLRAQQRQMGMFDETPICDGSTPGGLGPASTDA